MLKGRIIKADKKILIRGSMMDTEMIFQLAGISIVITVIYTVLKQAGRDEFAFSTLLLGIVVALAMVIPKIANLFETVRSVFGIY